MTSRTLSNKLFRTEFMRYIWIYVICAIIVIGQEPIGLLMTIDSNLSYGYMSWAGMVSSIKMFFEYSYGADCILPTALAFFMAILSFSYLYSKSAQDLYHSLPITRGKLFAIKYLAGFAPMMVTLILCDILSALVVLGKGYMCTVLIKVMLIEMARQIVVAFIIYNVTITAITLTGNFLVGIAGAVAIAGYFDALFTVIELYMSSFYQTYYQSPFSENIFVLILSPINIINIEMEETDNLGLYMLVALLVGVAYLVAAYVLYKRRPSESVGKPLCFSVSKHIIRIMISILAALAGGIYVTYISYNLSPIWFWGSFIVIGFLAHAALEMIFEQDFKAFLMHKIQLAGSLAIAAIVAIVFIFDLTGFDRFVPNANRIESASIALESIDSIDYFEETTDEITGETLWNYVYPADMFLENVRYQDASVILDMAKIGISELNGERNGLIRNRIEYGAEDIATEEVMLVDAAVSYSQDVDLEKNCYTVCYHLKSGRDVYRRYSADMNRTYEDTAKIYSSEQYKNSRYQLELFKEKNLIKDVTGTNAYYQQMFDPSMVEGDKLIDAMIADYNNRTLDDLVGMPVLRLSSYDNINYMDVLYSYLIYPTDTNTLAYLESCGVNLDKLDATLSADRVLNITVTDYEASAETEVYKEGMFNNAYYEMPEDREIIEKVLTEVVPNEFLYVNSVLNPYSGGVDAEINYMDETGMTIYVYGVIPYDRIPYEVAKDIGR